MSALPPKADIWQRGRHVRFGPKADIHTARGPAVWDRKFPMASINSKTRVIFIAICRERSHIHVSVSRKAEPTASLSGRPLTLCHGGNIHVHG